MRAAFVKELQGIDRVELGQQADLTPMTGEALIRVHAAAVGPWDVGLVNGAFADFPVREKNHPDLMIAGHPGRAQSCSRNPPDRRTSHQPRHSQSTHRALASRSVCRDPMTASKPEPRPPRYEISVRGRLGEMMRSAFPAFQATTRGEDTVLTGTLADAAALYGVLAELEALGLELIEVRLVPPDAAP